MAFNMSYKGLIDRDIKYIYSNQPITFVTPRKQRFRPLKEDRPLPPLKRYPKRFYDYYRRYDIGIPRAPAFRATDPEAIERIVGRICKPIECQKSRRMDLQDKNDPEDGTDAQANEGGETDRSDASTRKERAREIAAMVERLQKPTESWKLKTSCRHSDNAQTKSNVPSLPPISC